MTMYVIDASVVTKWFINEEEAEIANEVCEDL